MTTAQRREYLVLSQYMPEADWTVNVLMDTASVRAQARTTIIAIVLFLALASLAFAIVMQRRARLAERMRMQTGRITNWNTGSRSVRRISPSSISASKRKSPSGG